MKKILLSGIYLLCSIGIFSQSWSLSGNSGTNSSSNFLGTMDSSPLVLKVNNVAAGYSGHGQNDYANVSFGYCSLTNPSAGGRNVAVGVQALTRNSSGWSNIAIGYWAMDANYTGCENIAIGVSSMAQCAGGTSWNVALGANTLKINQGYHNTAIGTYTLNYNTAGSLNTAVGSKSLLYNTTGNNNTAIGAQSMVNNTTGSINLGCGSGSLYSNTTGSHNTAVGNSSLWSNDSGTENTATGDESLAGNIDGSFNTAMGTRALWCGNNLSSGFSAWGHGNKNTAIGWESIRSLTTGSQNCALGYHSMLFTNTGSNNVAFGNEALLLNTTGEGNVAIGYSALYSSVSGSHNTAIGYETNVASENLSNTIVIGYGASALRSNSATIGNSSVTSIGGSVDWTTLISDDSKQNISENVPGLSFVNQLEPVTYSIGDKATYSGFTNKSVKAAAENMSYNFNGIDESNGTLYGLRYAAFVAPMVQSIKELSAENEKKDSIISTLENRLIALESKMSTIMNTINSYNSIETKTTSTASLGQNYPNPSNGITTIKYSLPESFSSAQIQFVNTNGDVLKRTYLTKSEESQIKVSTHSFSGYDYCYYSLIVDGKLIDTKKMILK